MEGPMPPMKGASTHWGHQGPIAGILHLPPICWLGDVLEMTGAQYSGLWDYCGILRHPGQMPLSHQGSVHVRT